MLAAALEAEVDDFVGQFADALDASGRRVVRRNGFAQERKVQTGLGDVAVRAPRVRDDRKGHEERVRFTSSILPPYLRRTKAVEELLPWLYLKGISTGGFQEALSALLGPDAPGLSATQIVRLKAVWDSEYEAWTKRRLGHKRIVYMWADGIYFNMRLSGERSCILVVMGATADGDKELLAVHDGVRESEISWKDVLLDLRERGMTAAPEIAVGDGALGFWKALREVFPTTREQRCTVHKTVNVLNKLPSSVEKDAKRRLNDIFQAPTRKDAEHAFDVFGELFGAKHQKAVACLEKDREELLAFYDFPAEHWTHLRTTNPIESTFATVRLRTKRTKGAGSAKACLAMVFKLALAAQRNWRKLNAATLLADVITGVQFKDGIKVAA